MRARLIVNPAAGADTALTRLPLFNTALRKIYRDVDVTVTTDAADAERAAMRAVIDGSDALYVAGGDGTLNATVRGLLLHDDTPPPLGIIPVGTGNDFAKALGLDEDAEAALDALTEPMTIGVDIGLVNDRPFINTSAGGFVADVSQATTEVLKDVTGKLAYVIGGAKALFSAAPLDSTFVRHDGDGRTNQLTLQMFVVANGTFIGGGYPIAPEARLDDGLLDVLFVPEMPLLDFVGVLQAIASGTTPTQPNVRQFRSSSFDLQFTASTRLNTDGELLEARTCHYRVKPKALRFFCGRAPRASAAPEGFDGRR